MTENLLGDFLRARRGRVSPEAAGVVTSGVRRVPGLRREEVATRAGVSVDYYVRLEQGRERNPSAQVLDAIARALRLDDDARLHLFRVAGLTPRTHRGAGPERADPGLSRLLEMWPENPALVLGKAYDVLAANRLAYALFDGLRHGPNLLMKVFLDPEARTFYPDWDRVAANTVAGFRTLHGEAPHDPRIREVLEAVRAGSPDFAAMWQRHDARRKRLERKRFRHPQVGELTLRMHAFDVKSAPGQELVVYHAEPGSASADALRLLGTLDATHLREQHATRTAPGPDAAG
ncbi:transcriptional regulator with XRE-family HTH domain [Prauserella shujinwangii]|uniref:Transcriptional regulator with XRE-family HTH domain n=1 Tax=Prauserella shujinwangii TaxID=1453103 RepID=A0A2T0M3X3_9PSEU|nr:helix-turn-helix transcriptional regulator [Prauserella shujinwangii]PRX51455.1 transcriptional regulator with XRE-family HTH domain [Prauserella shujinwangii]